MENEISEAHFTEVDEVNGYSIFRLERPIICKIDGIDYSVPQGFKTDFASIPYPVSKFIKRDSDKYRSSCVVHDMLYRKKVNRFEADELFFKCMVAEGTPMRYAIPFYLAVRLFGGKRWNSL
jgi:hypothetical protein